MKRFLIFFMVLGTLLCGCTDTSTHSQAVYMLLDTSGTYTAELKKAQAIINFLLGRGEFNGRTSSGTRLFRRTL